MFFCFYFLNIDTLTSDKIKNVLVNESLLFLINLPFFFLEIIIVKINIKKSAKYFYKVNTFLTNKR
jgi:hypothetical protein